MAGGATASTAAFPNAAGGFVNPTAAYTTLIIGDGTGMMETGMGICNFLQAAQAGDSPFASLLAYNPDLMITESQNAMLQFDNETNNIIPMAKYSAFIAQALIEANKDDAFPDVDIENNISSAYTSERDMMLSALDTAMAKARQSVLDAALETAGNAVASAPLEAMVNAYGNRIRKQYLTAISRLASSMADINAVNSSAFVFGMASIEKQMTADIDAYSADLDKQIYTGVLDLYKSTMALYLDSFKSAFANHIASIVELKRARVNNRDNFVISTAPVMEAVLKDSLESRFRLAQSRHAANMDYINAKTNETNKQLEITNEDSLWDFKLFGYASNMLGAASGVAAQTPGLSTGQQITSGVFGLASAAITTFG